MFESNHIAGVRNDVISSIKERVKSIMMSNSEEPVYLDGIAVKAPLSYGNGIPVTVKLNSIFCDDADLLCADIIGDVSSYNSGVIFGCVIEDMRIEELEKIICYLNTEYPVSERKQNTGRFIRRRPFSMLRNEGQFQEAH